MVVDIVPQQQLPEVFHHCSHKNNSNTMTNGHRVRTDDLGRKADQILGHATSVVDYCRQPSLDFSIQHPPRLNIPVSKSRVSPVTNKNKNPVTVEQLVPLIFKLVTSPTYKKLPETITRYSKPVESHEDILPNLSDDDEEEEEENEQVNDENPSKIQHSDSDMENDDDDEENQTNAQPLSLIDFLPVKHSPIVLRKRSISPSASSTNQTKRKEELIRSFSSSVNIPMDIKQPTLPITIPTYLFFDQSINTEDDQVRTAKRYANGSIKQEPNTDMTDNGQQQQKKSKTSHTTMPMNIKEEPMVGFSNELPYSTNTATVAPMIVQPKKEKPTANVKPLLQTTVGDSSSSTINNSNVLNQPDRLTTVANASTRANYVNIRNMSTKELNALARKKKKQADGEKRTFDDVKQSMSLYLESVCYFIQCANDEPIVEQRHSLLTATLAMLQHLAHNYQKMFHIPTNESVELLQNIRQKFLLINYWLQSYIYHLQFQTNFSSIERVANQVQEYFNNVKSPSDVNQNTLYDFSKQMLNSYYSNYYWNKAERLIRGEELLKKFFEQLLRQNQNKRLGRDDTTLDFLLYIFDAIDLLRITTI